MTVWLPFHPHFPVSNIDAGNTMSMFVLLEMSASNASHSVLSSYWKWCVIGDFPAIYRRNRGILVMGALVT